MVLKVKTCGAKTRSGTSCKRLPCVANARCSLHGGKSLAGIAHPNYKHGRYTVTLPSLERMLWLKERRLRKERRFMRAVFRKFGIWYERHPRSNVKTQMLALRCIHAAHLYSLARRRARYMAKKETAQGLCQTGVSKSEKKQSQSS